MKGAKPFKRKDRPAAGVVGNSAAVASVPAAKRAKTSGASSSKAKASTSASAKLSAAAARSGGDDLDDGIAYEDIPVIASDDDDNSDIDAGDAQNTFDDDLYVYGNTNISSNERDSRKEAMDDSDSGASGEEDDEEKRARKKARLQRRKEKKRAAKAAKEAEAQRAAADSSAVDDAAAAEDPVAALAGRCVSGIAGRPTSTYSGPSTVPYLPTSAAQSTALWKAYCKSSVGALLSPLELGTVLSGDHVANPHEIAAKDALALSGAGTPASSSSSSAAAAAAASAALAQHAPAGLSKRQRRKLKKRQAEAAAAAAAAGGSAISASDGTGSSSSKGSAAALSSSSSSAALTAAPYTPSFSADGSDLPAFIKRCLPRWKKDINAGSSHPRPAPWNTGSKKKGRKGSDGKGKSANGGKRVGGDDDDSDDDFSDSDEEDEGEGSSSSDDEEEEGKSSKPAPPPARTCVTPSVVVVTYSAIRAVQLLKPLGGFNARIAKCFAKHLSLEETVQALRDGPPPAMAVGTPNRLARLIEGGHLNLSNAALVVLDLHPDLKSFCLLDHPDVAKDAWVLFKEALHPALVGASSSSSSSSTGAQKQGKQKQPPRTQLAFY